MAVQAGELKRIAQKVLDISNVIDYRELRITYAQKALSMDILVALPVLILER